MSIKRLKRYTMGVQQTYKCNKCNYESLISCGKDMGDMVETLTCCCTNCQELVDVVTRIILPEYLKDVPLMTCPICHSSDNITRWNNRKKKCPRCDGQMSFHATGRILLWD